MKLSHTKRIVIIALLIAVALVLHVVEDMLPLPMLAPGVKLGLANIVTLVAIVLLGYREALFIVAVRSVLGSAIGGAPVPSFLFSITGGLFATIIMSIMYLLFRETFSLMAISVAGAVAHNVGQFFIASIVISNFGLYMYLPVLLLSAMVTGYFVGLTARLVLKRLECVGPSVQKSRAAAHGRSSG